MFLPASRMCRFLNGRRATSSSGTGRMQAGATGVTSTRIWWASWMPGAPRGWKKWWCAAVPRRARPWSCTRRFATASPAVPGRACWPCRTTMRWARWPSSSCCPCSGLLRGYGGCWARSERSALVSGTGHPCFWPVRNLLASEPPSPSRTCSWTKRPCTSR